jgi:hypothetical protein
MSKQKIFIIGLIILISISVILRLNLKQKPQLLRNQPPTPVISQPMQEPQQKSEEIDTSNWKTYRNEKYGFEVKLPLEYEFDNKQMKLLFNDESSLVFYVFFPGLETGPNTERIREVGLISPCSKEISIDQISKVFSFIPENEDFNEDCVDTEDDKYTFSTMIPNEERGGTQYGFLLLSSNKSDFKKFFPIYQTVISTFKFIEIPDGDIDISNWKTYRNNKFKFELKYPSDLIEIAEDKSYFFIGPTNPLPAIRFKSKRTIDHSGGFGSGTPSKIHPLDFSITLINGTIKDYPSLFKESEKFISGKNYSFDCSCQQGYRKDLTIINEQLSGYVYYASVEGSGAFEFYFDAGNNQILTITYNAPEYYPENEEEYINILLNGFKLPKSGVNLKEITADNEHFIFAKILSTLKVIK